jgi:phage terminase large subunit-like protein
MARKRSYTSTTAAVDPSLSTQTILSILDGFDPKNPASVAAAKEKAKLVYKLPLLRMTPTQERFIRVKNRFGRTPRTRVFEAGNQSGKTVIGVAEDLAHAMGYRCWLNTDDPDFRIRIKVPNSGMVGCEVAGQTLAQRIEPLFREFVPPQCEPEYDKYSDGSMKLLRLPRDYFGNKCGSIIHFRSYVQAADTYEGPINDWLHYDEPPPQDIFNAANRGKMASNAPSWLTMTPLKEPYIYDILSCNAFNNDMGGTDDEIAIFRCPIWDNCQDYCRECDLDIPENTPDAMEAAGLQPGSPRPKNRCPQCRRILGFMPRAGIDNYLKTITDEDEREAREEGKWKHLSGSVYKKFSKATHTYEDFTIPRDWMRIESVDPADSKPTRWLFGAVSPEDITINSRLANRIYFYAYLLLDGSIDSMVRSVRIKRAEHDYKEPAMVILDAKFGTRTVHTAEAETSWEEELVKAGIKHIVISQSAPGDVALGHKRVKEYLAPHYSKTKGIEFPGMLFAAVGCSGQRSPIQDMSNYRWQEGKDKPEEAFKDFPDCVRYVALEQPLYSVQKLDDYEPPPPPIQQYNPLYYGLSMGGI